MAKRTYPGVCHFCKAQFNKAGIVKHLAACPQRQEAEAKRRGKRRPIVDLVVEGHGQPQYWMVIEVPADATLFALDGYLRNVWLECCGHMSAFTIGDEQYYSSGEDELEGLSMDYALGDLVETGDQFLHEYDFGTTTELLLKVVGRREGVIANKINALATNLPPDIRCACGEPATQVCSQCIWEGPEKGWLCDQCAAEHDCGEEMLLPVVNSPRVGMCAYTG